MSVFHNFAITPTDSDEFRQEKKAALLITGSCCLCGTVWTAMYYYLFGICLTTLLPLGFVAIVGASIALSHVRKNHLWAVYAQIICIIYITACIQWSIGGVFDSGFVMAWAFIGPITALMFFSLKESLLWLSAYLVNIGVTVFFNSYFISHGQFVSEETKIFFFIMNLGVSSLVIFAFAFYFVSNTLKEREKVNKLLLNILPKSIAQMLKNNTKVIAHSHESVSVLFADIVGFTEYSSKAPAKEVVETLDKIFNAFDELTEKYQLEKIKTIGDGYMVAGGIPDYTPHHAQSIARMALEMCSALENITFSTSTLFTVRIGIHCGSVVAGVIGKSKFAYDLWGDTVNVASRMESNGKPGIIQASKTMYDVLHDEFELESQGFIEVKGKGQMETFHLLGVKRGKDKTIIGN